MFHLFQCKLLLMYFRERFKKAHKVTLHLKTDFSACTTNRTGTASSYYVTVLSNYMMNSELGI